MTDTRELDVIEHLEELRTAVIRTLVWLTVGAAIAWSFRIQLTDLLAYPALEGARRAGLEQFSFHIFEPAGGILLMMQVSLLGGAMLMFGFIVWELWRFIRPALTIPERRYVYIILPASVLLFAGGVGFCYLVTPTAFGFLLRFNVQLGVEPQFILGSYLRFFMRLLLVFGLAFQTPLVLWFLARLEVVSSARLLSTWRWAVVIIMLIAAIVTPTPDPFNMMLLAGPMIVLYFLSVGLVELVERPRRKRKQAAENRERQSAQTGGSDRQALHATEEAQQQPDMDAADAQSERFYAETGGTVPPQDNQTDGQPGSEQ